MGKALEMTDWTHVLSIGAPIVVALVTGSWAVFRWRHDRLFRQQRRKAYEQVFEHVCIGTVPRLSSFDWKQLGGHFLPITPKTDAIIKQAEELDIRYRGPHSSFGLMSQESLVEANIAWVKDRCLCGENMINSNRLFISKADTDNFREYLQLAYAYSQSSDDNLLPKMRSKRDELALLVKKLF